MPRAKQRTPELRDRLLQAAMAMLADQGVGAETPFTGWKASGVGPAEHGTGDPEFYTRPQAVYVDDAPPRRVVD